MNSLKQNLTQHPLSAAADGSPITLAGYSKYKPESLACYIAGEGNHFLQYGIIEGSMLLVCTEIAPQFGDLVITGSPQRPAVRLYVPDNASETIPGECPTASEKDHILAVILSTFNFYQ